MVERGLEVEKDAGSPRAPLPCPGSPYPGSGLRAVILATMMLSGRGVATALKVPFQNFSKSCFSPCCTPAMAPGPRASPAAVRGAERYIPRAARPGPQPGPLREVRPRPPPPPVLCRRGGHRGRTRRRPLPGTAPAAAAPGAAEPRPRRGRLRGTRDCSRLVSAPPHGAHPHQVAPGGLPPPSQPQCVRAPSPSFPSPAERPLPARCWTGGTAALCPSRDTDSPGRSASPCPHRSCLWPSCLLSPKRT